MPSFDEHQWRLWPLMIKCKRCKAQEQTMLDLILLAGGLGFFVVSIAYAYGCERL
jgi:hypothetical protein